jgi:hypothetical protein
VTARRALAPPRWRRAFACRCGRPVFFRNSRCLACGAALGFDAEQRSLRALQPADGPGWWVDARAARPSRRPRWRRCSELEGASGCNWLVAEHDRHAGEPPRCRCCRLLRTRPDLASPEHATWFQRVETARRLLVASLLGLGLPVASKQEDPAQGLAFDILRAQEGAAPVMTGHADGVITLDLEEAEHARREQRRVSLNEPYRTLLGHLRHESGHYYWWRLLADDESRLAVWRDCFGDERSDYAAALRRHYAEGAPADWALHHVSAYASAHPWEDWAETWAHYLHLSDTLDTARSYGLDGTVVALDYEPLPLGEDIEPEFAALSRSWMELTGVLNELSRSMGVSDFYPFVLSADALRKLQFVHRLIGAQAAAQPAA